MEYLNINFRKEDFQNYENRMKSIFKKNQMVNITKYSIYFLNALILFSFSFYLIKIHDNFIVLTIVFLMTIIFFLILVLIKYLIFMRLSYIKNREWKLWFKDLEKIKEFKIWFDDSGISLKRDYEISQLNWNIYSAKIIGEDFIFLLGESNSFVLPERSLEKIENYNRFKEIVNSKIDLEYKY